MRIKVIGVSALSLLVGGAIGVVARDGVRPAEAQNYGGSATMEYQSAAMSDVLTDEDADKLLNSFAKEGWRFVGELPRKGGTMAVFERPRGRAVAKPKKAPPADPGLID